jgi:hypothetical protein
LISLSTGAGRTRRAPTPLRRASSMSPPTYARGCVPGGASPSYRPAATTQQRWTGWCASPRVCCPQGMRSLWIHTAHEARQAQVRQPRASSSWQSMQKCANAPASGSCARGRRRSSAAREGRALMGRGEGAEGGVRGMGAPSRAVRRQTSSSISSVSLMSTSRCGKDLLVAKRALLVAKRALQKSQSHSKRAPVPGRAVVPQSLGPWRLLVGFCVKSVVEFRLQRHRRPVDRAVLVACRHRCLSRRVLPRARAHHR